MAQQNVLPDPNHGRAKDGEESSSAANLGPGFASVKLSSNQQVMSDRTNSGRLVQRSHAYHKWSVDITYNPMTKEDFQEVFAFLLERRSTLAPFFVQLPQHRGHSSSDNRSTTALAAAGATTMTLQNDTAHLVVGDLFTVTDSNNTDHKKAYMVTKVNTSTDVITFTPPLAKEVSSGATAVFQNPLIKVIQTGDTQQYSLNSNNLYSFSLKLEEVQ